MYSENVLHVRHDVWDVHTDVDRWWVITEPMNLYAQEQFPNMDLALTFHVGLCLRIPRSERQKLSELPVEPFAEYYRCLQEASDALNQASEVADYQAIGVRCREALLALATVVQRLLPWTSSAEPPKKADLKACTDHICNVALAGAEHEHRRHLYKTLLESACKFVNWLTHTKSSSWQDAEAGIAVIDSIVLTPEKGQLRIELRRNLAAMLTAAQKTKRSPDTGDLPGAGSIGCGGTQPTLSAALAARGLKRCAKRKSAC